MHSSEELFIGPCNLMAIPQNESVLLKWNIVDGAEGYRIFMCEDIKKQFNAIKYSTAPEKVIYGLSNHTEYFFKVKAFKFINGKEVYSDFSEAVRCIPKVRGFAVTKPFLILSSSQSYNIYCTYDGITTDNIKYTSSNENIATVNKSGTITAISRGEALITAFSPVFNQSAEVKVVVDRVALEPVLPIEKPRFIFNNGIYVNPDSINSLSASIIFTGDMMCISNQQKTALKAGVYNFYDSFKLLRPVISDSDFSIGTLETMLSESHPYASEELKVDKKPNCNAPSNFLDGVHYAGFDAVVTATNHSCDTELSGIKETLSHIKRYNLMNLGIGERYFIVEINGIKVAFFAYTMITNRRDGFLNEQQKESIICTYSKNVFESDYNSAKECGAEFFIVMMHWGIMNSSMVRERQAQGAQEIADIGADYIVGSHPHVLQKADIIKSKNGKKVPVIYSLGNLISSMREMTDNTNTMILRLNLEKNNQGVKINSSQYISCVILPKYMEVPYVTAPILQEFCGYSGTSTLHMLQSIDSIKGFADGKIHPVDINDPIFKKLEAIAPEARFFSASASIKEDTLSLEWEQIDGAEGYRIYGQSGNGDFIGVCNSAINRTEINIGENITSVYKIKAFRTVNGSMDFFRTSVILYPYSNYLSEEQESSLFKADGFSIGNLVVLKWDNVSGADGYRIYKKNTDDKYIGLLNSDINFRRITNLEVDNNHDFKIKAFKTKNGQKEFFASSNNVSIFLPYCHALPALSAEAENGVKLNWVLDRQAEGYRVYRENPDGVFLGVTDVSDDEFFDVGCEEVRYKVKPYITFKSQRLYYNSSNILTKIPAEQKEHPLISFVVPEYNDEKYLERFFNSILSNVKINCEVIVVNDGSTDNSQKIIDKYCEKFPIVFVSIVKENGGVSNARNAGVAAAKGKYIGFLDSDDCIRPEACQLYEKAIETDSDIIIGTYYKYEKSKKIVIQGKLPFEEYKKLDIDLYLTLLYGKGYAGQAPVWNKLYRAELIKDRPMPSIKSEDVAWSPYIASYAKSFCYIATPLYEYLRREGSISDIINKYTDTEIFERRMKSINFFLENGNPQKKNFLYAIAEKRLEWHIKNTTSNSLYTNELERLRSKVPVCQLINLFS